MREEHYKVLSNLLLDSISTTLIKTFDKYGEVTTEHISYALIANRIFPTIFYDAVRDTYLSSIVESWNVAKDRKLKNADLTFSDIVLSNECELFVENLISFTNRYSNLLKSTDIKNYIAYSLMCNTDYKSHNHFAKSISVKSYNSITTFLRENIYNSLNFNVSTVLKMYGTYISDPLSFESHTFYGRECELEQCVDILCRRDKNNLIIVGQPGVGKTALVKRISNVLSSNNCPDCLMGKYIYSLDLSRVISGTKYRGDFEERLNDILSIFESDSNLICFIDEIHTIFQHGRSTDGGINASDLLKPFLSSGKSRVIGATTVSEFKIIETDKAIERRFTPIHINELTVSDTVNLLMTVKSNYEEFHKIEVPDNVLTNIVELSDMYLTRRYFPDKALDVLDSSCVFSKNHSHSNTLSEQDVIETVSKLSGVPISSIGSRDLNNYNSVIEKIKTRIIGQDSQIDSVFKLLKRHSMGLSDNTKPIGSFLFVGPTGVGKTELCKLLAECYYSKESFIRFDMSEYSEKYSVSTLIGSPPGYIGYDTGGVLTEKVKHNPHSVILFDEIEKAHPDIFNIFLQILDDGVLTDSSGDKIDFTNTFIVFTSNCGSKESMEYKQVGFTQTVKKSEVYEKSIKDKFRPEFINRLDDIIYFNSLDYDSICSIVDNQIISVIEKFRLNGFNVDFDYTSIDQLCKKCYNREYGARFVQRTIQSMITDVVIDYLYEHQHIKDVVVRYCDSDDSYKCFERVMADEAC